MQWYWSACIIGAIIGVVIGWNYSYVVDWFAYRRARKDIFAFVESYKRKCTGNNRFIVTVESLQDSFREYNTNVITKVWLDLVHNHTIQTDPQDGEWVVR